MTATAAHSASARQARLQAEVESVTRELQANGSAAPTLLLRRAQAYADMGDEALAREDIARAAELVKDPKYKTPESVAAVERAFHDMSVSGRPKAADGAPEPRIPGSADRDGFEPSGATNEDIIARVLDGKRDAVQAAAVLERRILAKRAALDGKRICQLVDSFHELCAQRGSTADADGLAAALALCIGAAFSQLARPDSKPPAGDSEPGRDTAARSALAAAVAHTVRGWAPNDTNGEFKQRACRFGARMYASAACALATDTGHARVDDSETAGALRDAYGFYMAEVWPIGSLPSSTAATVGDVCKGALRLLAANRPLFVFTFANASAAPKTRSATASSMERLLGLLGQSADTAADEPASSGRSLAMLLANQLAAAARDPENSALFPGYDAAARSSGPPRALVRLRAAAVEMLDGWVQSTIQAERRRGLLATAALYEAGAGTDLAADLWLKTGWAEELWDQGEFDKPETQLALLRLADACSTDAGASARMRTLGSGLVQALARKSGDSNSASAGLAGLASVVLAKWSGLPAGPAAPGTGVGAAAAAPAAEGPAEDMAGVDPIQLADTHTKRILAHAGSAGGAAADDEVVEKSAEALGYLCLKPQSREHVARNTELLQALFALARKSDRAALRFATVMLIGNLTRYRPVLSDEQKRMQQLQRLNAKAQGRAGSGDAQAGSDKPRTVAEELKDDAGGEDSELDAAEAVAGRAARVCSAGGISVLVSAVQSKARPSDSVKDAVAETMVSLATSPGLRGLMVQQGGVRALLGILTADAPKAAAATKADDGAKYAPKPLVQKRDRDIAFALAKLAISVPPNLAFRDPRELVRLLLSLLAEDAANQALLMRFEALLALTNLASAEPGSPDDVRGYINALDGMSLIEMAMLSEHSLVRRAATELVCNLVYDADVFERFARGADKYAPIEDDPDAPAELLPSGIVELPSDDEGVAPDETTGGGDAYRAQRLHLLIALADVDDVATRSAASGALAVLSSDPRCCRYLFLAHPRAADVLLGLADDATLDDDGARAAFRHRVGVVWANAAGCGDARVAARMRRQPGLVELLQRMAGDTQAPYHAAAKSALVSLGGADR